MRVRARAAREVRLLLGVALGLALIGAGCASTDPRVAHTPAAESPRTAGWEKCEPAPKTSFFLFCYRR